MLKDFYSLPRSNVSSDSRYERSKATERLLSSTKVEMLHFQKKRTETKITESLFFSDLTPISDSTDERQATGPSRKSEWPETSHTANVGRKFAAALLSRLFGKNPTAETSTARRLFGMLSYGELHGLRHRDLAVMTASRLSHTGTTYH